MFINNTYFINATPEGAFETNLMKSDAIETFNITHMHYETFSRIYNQLSRKKLTGAALNSVLDKLYNHLDLTTEQKAERFVSLDRVTVDNDPDEEYNVRNLQRDIEGFFKFFSEWKWEISYRYVDTFLRSTDRVAYTKNYFKLQGHTEADEIAEKLDSPEFKKLLRIKYIPKNQSNKHIKVYYGPAGTGKTRRACKEADGLCIICSSDMSCTDLLRDFDFEDGKPGYEKSDLWRAIVEGKKIVFDEINLLNKDTLKFLQGLTDGKKFFNFVGHKIEIHPDFQIIGTMNLIMGGIAYPLPEPIVDRCSEIEEMTLTPELLTAMLTSEEE